MAPVSFEKKKTTTVGPVLWPCHKPHQSFGFAAPAFWPIINLASSDVSVYYRHFMNPSSVFSTSTPHRWPTLSGLGRRGKVGVGWGGLNNQHADLKCGSLKHNLRAWATAVHQPHFLLCCFTNGSWKLNQNQGWRCTDGNNSLVIRAGKGPVQCADSPCAPVLTISPV